jgi:hypothetical protein
LRIAWANEIEDRSDIERVISTLNDGRTNLSQKQNLFTSESQNELDRLSSLDRRMVTSDIPLSEVTTPRVVIQSVRFITPDVALVDAANTQYGSVVLVRRVPVLFVMRKEREGWRITAVRVLVDRYPGCSTISDSEPISA